MRTCRQRAEVAPTPSRAPRLRSTPRRRTGAGAKRRRTAAEGARPVPPGFYSVNRQTEKERLMAQEFKRGDKVEWSFRGRPVRGTVRRRLTRRTEIAGQVVAASKDDPRYVVRTDKSKKDTTRRPGALRAI